MTFKPKQEDSSLDFVDLDRSAAKDDPEKETLYIGKKYNREHFVQEVFFQSRRTETDSCEIAIHRIGKKIFADDKSRKFSGNRDHDSATFTF